MTAGPEISPAGWSPRHRDLDAGSASGDDRTNTAIAVATAVGANRYDRLLTVHCEGPGVPVALPDAWTSDADAPAR